MAAPTFVSETETSWTRQTGQTKVTASISVQSGDRMVAYSGGEGTKAVTVSDSGGNTWSLDEDRSNNSRVRMWTATAAGTASITVTFDKGDATNYGFGGGVQVYRSSDGFGAAESGSSGSAPSLAITTTQANSAIVIADADWNAADGTSRTWRTVNGSAATEDSYFRDSVVYAVYAGHHVDAGSVGAKTVGLSAPTGQLGAIAAVEVKGSAGGGAAAPRLLSSTGVGT